ncbi:MAG: hypothetical protein IT332_01845 [Ardenticatenales bacterium]|nr:hypothetical protein [Ardenticatenales bacterium]
MLGYAVVDRCARIAGVLAIAWMSCLVLLLMSTPTPPATASLRPSRTPTIVPPTRTPLPTTTPPPSPTVTAPSTPVPSPRSYPVSLTLEDARRSVRERMGAAPGLRVGGAAYVTGRDLFERWPYRPGVANAGLTYLEVIHSFDWRSTEPQAAPLADVVVVVDDELHVLRAAGRRDGDDRRGLGVALERRCGRACSGRPVPRLPRA